MAEDFAKAVDDGIKLSKRIYFGKDRAVAPPKPPAMMDKSAQSYLPSAPMVYAVICDPGIVDNPDIPSYQPHVHGRCDPPALIPLQMNRVELEADCCLDTAIVRVTGSWRVHCVMGSRTCDCRIAIPMGEQGSILGVEIDLPRKSFRTQAVTVEGQNDSNNVPRIEDGGFLTPNIFTLSIPQVDGGSNLSVTISWSQKLLYQNGQMSLSVPFSFPDYVTPAGKKLSKKEKILLNVNAGAGTEVLCNLMSHPLKEIRRQAGNLSLLYEAEVLSWSRVDFSFSYQVSAAHVFGGVLLQSPHANDADQREIFCMYLYPGNQRTQNVVPAFVAIFRKQIVFAIDISGSMRSKLLDDVKNALFEAISKLEPEDSFNIIAFNSETFQFSTSMEMATKETVENAIQWIGMNFVAGGGTNILLPLTKAMEMLSNGGGSVPIILLVTDGAVEDERSICDLMKKNLSARGPISPRIYTFGIGPFCNHYFLRMLAMIGRGHYDAAHDVDSVELRMNRLCSMASAPLLVNITVNSLDDLDDVEVYPSFIPDLTSQSLLTVSGRYRGNFPDLVEAEGLLPDLCKFQIHLKVKQSKDIPIWQALSRDQIQLLTALVWFSENKQLEEKVVKISTQTGLVSEYTRMAIIQTDSNNAAEVKKKANSQSTMDGQKMMLLPEVGLGFGNLTATADNTVPGVEEPKLPEAAEILVKAASNCCSRICAPCCCPCCIQACSGMNNQCATVLTQLCTALACFACIDCWAQLCCSSND